MVRKPQQKQIRPARVYQTVTTLLDHRVKPKLRVQKPVWFKVIESIPPSEILTRPFPPQHKTPNPKAKKASRLYQPQQLVYPEDSLRQHFYRDHPWELARPRMIIETDGKDLHRCDWSKGIKQPGIPLTGECVVQRQLWLMSNVHTKPKPGGHPGEVIEYTLNKYQAYDKARREFYYLRQEEQIERRVAQEEARHVGAYFGQGYLQVGMDLEDAQYKRWKKWATDQIETIRAEQSDGGLTMVGGVDGEGLDDLDGLKQSLEESVGAAE